MSELFNQSPYTSNPNQEENSPTGFGRIPGASDSSKNPGLPPPPPSAEAELDIRTMRSDLEQMGGQANAFGNFSFSAPQTEVSMQMASPSAGTGLSNAQPRGKFSVWLWILVGIGIAGILFAAGYYLLPKLTSQPKTAPPVRDSATTPPANTLAVTASSTFLGYSSFAKLPADGRFNLSLAAETGRQDFIDSVIEQVGQGNATSALSHFAEVVIKNPEGQAMPWTSYLAAMNSSLLSREIWQTHYEQGFNLYLLRDERGAWPVYVLKLKDDQSRSAAGADMAEMEGASAEFLKLFFLPPGEEMTGFEDKQVGGEPVRVMTYANPGARLVYGWMKSRYFLISASLESFEEAGRRL